MKKALLASFMCVCVLFADSEDVEGAVSFEVGIGYLNGSFTGKQSGSLGSHSTKGSAKGVDIYVAANSYITERFGISFGTGAEFINGGWNDECGAGGGMGAYNYSYAREVLNFYIAKTTDANSQRDKEALAAIKKVAGDDYDKAFDSSIAFDESKTGSQGYLYKSEGTDKRNKYEVKYTEPKDEQGNASGNYAYENGEYVYKGTGKEQYERTIQYVFENNAGKGAYNRKDDGDIEDTDGNKYEYVGEGKGDYDITQEEYYWYRYNGSVIDNRGLYCSTPKLNVKTWYLFLGAFYDVLRFEYFGMRVFGNVGIGYDMMKDKFSRATIPYTIPNDMGNYQMFYTYNSNETPSQEKGSVYMPLTAGVRFIIATNHGIELVGKYNLIKSKWKSTQHLYNGEFNGKDLPTPISIDTKITRDYSWGIRYVYEFR